MAVGPRLSPLSAEGIEAHAEFATGPRIWCCAKARATYSWPPKWGPGGRAAAYRRHPGDVDARWSAQRHDLAIVWDSAALRTSYAGLASETSGTGHRAVADAQIPLAPPRGWPGIEQSPRRIRDPPWSTTVIGIDPRTRDRAAGAVRAVPSKRVRLSRDQLRVVPCEIRWEG
jgi:hypothetical protein